ncbi:MAG: AAA family ATPase [Thermofilaceae archaeon]
MSSSYEVTLSDIEEKITRLEKSLKTEDIKYIVNRWLQGRALDIPIAKIRELLVKSKEMEATVREAVDELIQSLESPYGGVEIFSIESPRRTYGTGKSQVAYLLCKELERQGVPTQYLVVSIEDVESGNFRERLWGIGRSKSKFVIFIDEVDVLISPELEEERQAKVIEALANAIVEYSEGLSAFKGYNHALVLILSFKAREGIERIAQSRLGRRVMNTLVETEISLTRDDIFEIFTSTSALAAMHMNFKGERLLPLIGFANDFGRHLWSDSDLASLSVGEAVASALNLTLRFSRGLKSSDPKKVLQSSLDPAKLGTRIEKVVINTLGRALPSYDFEIKDLQQKVNCVINQIPIRVKGFQTDMHYTVRLGRLEIGKCLVEITAEREISPRKKEQLRAFADEYPTILVHVYEQPLQFEEVRKFLEELSGHGSVPIGIPLPLFKYPAALEAYGEELAFKLAEVIKLHESVGAALRKLASAIAYDWFAVKEAEEARKGPVEDAEKKLEEALKSSLKAALQHLFAEYSRRNEKTIVERFENALKKVLPGVERDHVTVHTKDVLKKWVAEGLGKITEKGNFIKSEAWDEGKALEIAVSILTPHLLKAKVSNGLEGFL